jgi:hypothetical protein
MVVYVYYLSGGENYMKSSNVTIIPYIFTHMPLNL